MLSYILALFSIAELARAATDTAEERAITTLSSVQVRSFKTFILCCCSILSTLRDSVLVV